MNAQEIRRKYLNYFKAQKHVVIDRAPLVLNDDPTTLFTGSGMQPLLPYLLGKNHPLGKRLTDSQVCLRSQDIDEIGDSRHTTFFEMLGNWSLGDYFKEEQIRWCFDFLVNQIGLNPNKIYVTAFIGDDRFGIPKDNETARIWQKVFKEHGIDAQVADIVSKESGDKRGIKPGERIFFYNDHENWWSRGGALNETPIGDPCGPDSEIFYDFGPEYQDTTCGRAHPASDGGEFMEIGNQVFTQYVRNNNGTFSALDKKNVDFGGGLERITAASMDNPDIFKTSLLWPIISKIVEISNKSYESNKSSMRVIADHLRGATFLAFDGVVPSNKVQGYVMRRLIRRAIRFALDLGIEQNFLEEVVPIIINLYADDYHLDKNYDEIIGVMAKEEKIFRQTLSKGLKQFKRFELDGLTGNELFTLYDTYGFPVELSLEEAYKQNISISSDWKNEFKIKMDEQRARSKTAAKGKFKGGLETSGSAIEVKYHTATHLLKAAISQVVGKTIAQRGCNIDDERIRFDFSYPEKLTNEQVKQIEDLVNDWIKADLPVVCREYSLDEAYKIGANGDFKNKYGEKVKVYTIGDISKPISQEICGGPHVSSTAELGEGGKAFKIIKEQSSSAGVRRIKAVLA